MTEFNNLRNRVAVIGVGTTAYGSFPETDEYGLAAEAFRNALADCSLDKSKIDGLLTCRIPVASSRRRLPLPRAKRTMLRCFTPTLADRVASSTGAMNRADIGTRGNLRLPARRTR